jgi:hypothetical protein
MGGGRWAVRSMLWVRKDIKCEHVIVPSADLTVALLRLPGRSMLLASVYVEGGNTAALSGTMRLLDDAISTAQRRGGPRLMLWSPATSIGMTSCGEETGSCRHDRPGAVNLKTSQGLSLASQVTHLRFRGSPKLRGPYRRSDKQGSERNLIQVITYTASKKVNSMLLYASQ